MLSDFGPNAKYHILDIGLVIAYDDKVHTIVTTQVCYPYDLDFTINVVTPLSL